MKLSRGSRKPVADAAEIVVGPVPDWSTGEAGAQVIDRLVTSKLLTRDDAAGAVRMAEVDPTTTLARVLLEGGLVSAADLARVLAIQFQVPLIDFRNVSPAEDAVALVPEQLARDLGVVPVALDGDVLHLAVPDPSPEVVARLSRTFGRELFPVLAAPAEIERAIDNSYRALARVDSHLHAFEVRDALRREAANLETVNANEEAPVVRVVQMMITQGLRDRASDIHIEPHDDKVRVRFRIDGALNDVLELPGSIGPAVVSRLKIMAEMNIVERRRPQDGQISMTVEDREVDIRVSTTAVVGGEKVVMRLLDKSRPLFSLAQLGMPSETAERYAGILSSPYGMVICAGPTGGGKTTTLYASLAEINSPERNIMTIEDPVEYTFSSINQIQIHEQGGITFATGLRSILRQDPDVILVGEIRDVETARIAVQSALTGHFVLSSLHATDAISALHRLLDMGIEPFLVTSSVTAVMAQRLVRKICSYCRETYKPRPDELAFVEAFGGSEPELGYMHGAGCNFCSHTGFLDRIGIYELLAVTDPVRELILDKGSHEELRKLSKAEGMHTLQEESIRLVTSGVTTAAEVMRSIYVAGG